MTRQQAIEEAPHSRASYWVNVCFLLGPLALFWKASLWHKSFNDIWPLYLLSAMACLVSIQAVERLLFPQRTALRSRALNIRFGRKIARLTIRIARIVLISLFVVCIYSIPAKHLNSAVVINGVLASMWLALFFIGDLLGQKPQDNEADFEHSPPLTEIKPMISEHWGSSPLS
jgi:hypothetical protein